MANNIRPQRSYWPAHTAFVARRSSVGWSLLLFVCVSVYTYVIGLAYSV